MKRIFFILMLVLLMAGCGENLTPRTASTHANGQPSVVQYVDRDNVVVSEKHYYDDGSLMMEGPIKDGERTGEWKGYFPDGKLQSTGFFEQGKRTGPATVYWSSGNLYMEGAYLEGRRVGKWRYYDEQGYFLNEVDLGE